MAQAATFGSTVLDMSDFPTRHPYSLGIWQNQIERIMAELDRRAGVPIRYGREVTGFAQDDAGVDVRLADGETLRAQYLVGCDGGRSVIRKAAGIEFPGWDPTRSNLIAEVEVSEEPPRGVRHDAAGVHALHRLEDGKTFRVIVTEQQLGPSTRADPGRAERGARRRLRHRLRRPQSHLDLPVHRHDPAGRGLPCRRVLLAGDAAHIHYPAGGQGLSLGVQDAVNLGWKLAQVVKGVSREPPRHLPRRAPPGRRRALRHTMAQGALQRRDERMEALVDVVSELAAMDEPRRRLAGIMSGLDIHYDLGDGHPLLGRRMPDLDLVTADGPVRVFELLHDARPLLLNLGDPGDLDVAPWADRVQLVDAELRGRVGASRARRGQRPHSGAGSPGRLRRLGGRGHRDGPRRRAHHLVRITVTTRPIG